MAELLDAALTMAMSDKKKANESLIVTASLELDGEIGSRLQGSIPEFQWKVEIVFF